MCNNRSVIARGPESDLRFTHSPTTPTQWLLPSKKESSVNSIRRIFEIELDGPSGSLIGWPSSFARSTLGVLKPIPKILTAQSRPWRSSLTDVSSSGVGCVVLFMQPLVSEIRTISKILPAQMAAVICPLLLQLSASSRLGRSALPAAADRWLEICNPCSEYHASEEMCDFVTGLDSAFLCAIPTAVQD